MKGLFAQHSYVGLDLGHHSIKAAQLEKTPSGWRVAKLASTPTPKDTIRDGVVVDPPVLGLVIKDLLRGSHFTASSASIGVAGGNVVVRPVRMPKMNESALRKSIRFEAGRYVPNSVDDSYIDFQIMGETEDNQMDVLIAAAPKEIVDGRLAACRHAGLDVEHVEVSSFAAMRSIYEAETHPDWADKITAIIDIGAWTTNLVLITSGTMAMVRTIPQGGALLTESLVKQFKISFEDAESGKGQLNLAELTQSAGAQENPPLRALQPQVDELLREIRRSINYWQTQQSGMNTKQIDHIILAGGGALFAGFDKYLEHKLGLPAASVDIFEKECFIGTGLESYAGSEWAVAVGLAMPLAKSGSAKASKPAAAAKPVKEKKARRQKAVAEPPVTDATETVETVPAAEAVEAPAKKPTRKRSAKKDAALAAESDASTVESTIADAAEVPAAFRPNEAEPAASVVAEAPAEAAAEKPAKAKGGLFSFSAAKSKAKADPKSATDSPSASGPAAQPEKASRKAPSKPLFSLFGKKSSSKKSDESSDQEAA